MELLQCGLCTANLKQFTVYVDGVFKRPTTYNGYPHHGNQRNVQLCGKSFVDAPLKGLFYKGRPFFMCPIKDIWRTGGKGEVFSTREL